MSHTYHWLGENILSQSKKIIYDPAWTLNLTDLTLGMIIKQLVSLTHLTLNRWLYLQFLMSKTGLRVVCLLEKILSGLLILHHMRRLRTSVDRLIFDAPVDFIHFVSYNVRNTLTPVLFNQKSIGHFRR